MCITTRVASFSSGYFAATNGNSSSIGDQCAGDPSTAVDDEEVETYNTKPLPLPAEFQNVTNAFFSLLFSPFSKQNHNGEFNWDAQLQGLILGAFYYGFCLTQILGGILAERYGGKWVFGLSLAMSSAITLTYPVAAETSVILFIILRALQGFFEGASVPAFYALVANWFPEQERAVLSTICLSGR